MEQYTGIDHLTSVAVKIYFSDNDLIPDEVQERLIYLRDIDREISFEIGDIANNAIRSVAAKDILVPDQRIFEAIGNFCGRRPRTVRYYYETARFYDQEARKKYDILSFSHFVAARTYGDDGWESFLELSMLHPQWSAVAVAAALQNSDSVAVAAYTSVAAYDSDSEFTGVNPKDISGFDVIGGNGSAAKKQPEISQSLGGSTRPYSQLETIRVVYSQLYALKEIVEQTEVDDALRLSLTASILSLRDDLPKLAKRIQ